MTKQSIDVNQDWNVTTVSVFHDRNSKLVARITASLVNITVRDTKGNKASFVLNKDAAAVLADNLRSLQSQSTMQHMMKHRTPEQYRALAAQWQTEADDELGKTLENGWTSREINDAERRRAYCLDKVAMCLKAADDSK